MSEKVWNEFWSKQENWNGWECPAKEVLSLVESQSPESRPNVLDLGCGLGRHAIDFARAEFTVTAIDSSKIAIVKLKEKAALMGLTIETLVCDVLDFQSYKHFFDIIVSYNVIYHGSRNRFAKAIRHIHKLLKQQGIFFFSAPTRQDGKYGFGEEVAPHTFCCEKSMTPGDIHYFANRADLDDLLSEYEILSLAKDEGYWNNRGVQQFYSNWQVLTRKTKPAEDSTKVI